MLSKLNDPQRHAAKYLDGPLLVLAGAGSGKTRVITHKIAYLIGECGMKAANIAAITFTNKAAREMQERVAGLVEARKLRGLTVSTFHSLGMQILRQEAEHLGLKKQFSILDAADTQAIISDIVESTDLAHIRGIQWSISRLKNAMLSPAQFSHTAEDDSDRVLAHVYQRYQDTLRAYQAVDFDDLIWLPVQLFETRAAVLEKWSSKLRYLLIDEYQDTNLCQYRLIRLLAGARGAFTAVGDDDQAIYAWRGADSENLVKLQADYPALQVIKLEQNYRSSVRILRAANAVIANNPKLFEKRLWSDMGMGDPIQVVSALNDEQEAQNVVMRLQMHRFQHRTRYADYAILYRGNHQARIFEQYLRNERIPYVMSGGTSFFERVEIKNLIAYLRLIANPDDEPAFIRAITNPRRGVGASSLEKLGEYARERKTSLFNAAFEAGAATRLSDRPLEAILAFCSFITRLASTVHHRPASEVLQELLAGIGYEAWIFDSNEAGPAKRQWENVTSFIEWLSRKGEEDGKDLVELAQTIALLSILEGRSEEDVDAVKLSTLHASKGLEYPHVFLVGVEEGILPHRESIENGQVDEERRLMYVGITRAQRSLTLSYCQKRKRGREWTAVEPSRFIDELPEEDVRHIGKGQRSEAEQKEEGKQWLSQVKNMFKNP